jgi:hypothetical protein
MNDFQWYSENMWKLRDWIQEKKLDFHSLCLNPHPGIIPILQRNWNRNGKTDIV